MISGKKKKRKDKERKLEKPTFFDGEGRERQ
jgi:hypothetical protein